MFLSRFLRTGGISRNGVCMWLNAYSEHFCCNQAISAATTGAKSVGGMYSDHRRYLHE